MPGLWALALGSLGDSDDAELDRDGGWHRFGELGTEAVGLGDAGDPRRHQGNSFVLGDGAFCLGEAARQLQDTKTQAARAEQRAEGDGGDGERVDRVVGIEERAGTMVVTVVVTVVARAEPAAARVEREVGTRVAPAEPP